jgi:penicillin-binding protein 1A
MALSFNQIRYFLKSNMAKKNQPDKNSLFRHRQPLLLGAFAVVALLGVVSGALFAYSPDLPEISELDGYTPGTITRIHDRYGVLIGEFATERRLILSYDEIPEVFRNAIVAAEDGDFFNHVGFNIPRIMITIASNIIKGDLTAAGASTITMQLARNVTLSGERLGLQKTWERKLQEAYYTFQIEKRYTKREILTLYVNQMWLGTASYSAYGVEAASRLYFGKAAQALDLGEAAMIAGIHQAPSKQSPLVSMELAKNRRNYALQRMATEGYVSQEEATEAMAQPITLSQRTVRSNSIAPYFIEEVRQHLETEYGVTRLYEEGLSVHTTLDARLQAAANKAIADGLRAHDKRRGFRTPDHNILDNANIEAGTEAAEKALAAYEHSRWVFAMGADDIVPAVVTSADSGAMQVRFGTHTATVVPKGLRLLASGEVAGFTGIGRTPADQLVRPGDLVEIKIVTLDTIDTDGNKLATPAIEAELDQEPLTEGALLAIENQTGRILAMVGGYDFNRSKFNRTTQAHRQLGSLFKGVLYAAAIDQGFTAASLVLDEPVSYDVGPGQDPYEPTNYDHTYEGPITLRRALEKSRNVPAVWMMNEIGPETVVDFARRLGFTSPIPPFLSVALGSAESTLLEVTSAYSAFPNRGTRMIPYQIERILDRTGNVLETGYPIPQDAVRPDTAYIMVSLMRGVVQRGTGVRASRLNWPLGGKTGTMDDYTDAWFVGFSPDISVGVWVGYDEKKTLGDEEEGARVALPIWIDFVRAHIDGREPPEEFLPPSNIVFRSINPMSGDVTEPWSTSALQEAFIAGTEPGAALFP